MRKFRSTIRGPAACLLATIIFTMVISNVLNASTSFESNNQVITGTIAKFQVADQGMIYTSNQALPVENVANTAIISEEAAPGQHAVFSVDLSTATKRTKGNGVSTTLEGSQPEYTV